MNGVARAICSWWSNSLVGWMYVEVTARRTLQDYARMVRWLVDEVPYCVEVPQSASAPGEISGT
jgi:hypothetical protein